MLPLLDYTAPTWMDDTGDNIVHEKQQHTARRERQWNTPLETIRSRLRWCIFEL
jgi:hypothetical protein